MFDYDQALAFISGNKEEGRNAAGLDYFRRADASSLVLPCRRQTGLARRKSKRSAPSGGGGRSMPSIRRVVRIASYNVELGGAASTNAPRRLKGHFAGQVDAFNAQLLQWSPACFHGVGTARNVVLGLRRQRELHAAQTISWRAARSQVAAEGSTT